MCYYLIELYRFHYLKKINTLGPPKGSIVTSPNYLCFWCSPVAQGNVIGVYFVKEYALQDIVHYFLTVQVSPDAPYFLLEG